MFAATAGGVKVRVVAIPAAPRAALEKEDGGQLSGEVGGRERYDPANAQRARRSFARDSRVQPFDYRSERIGPSRKKRRSRCSPFLPTLNDATGR
jgi:hypothetical protein